jgi:hypothetical protein|tara:strand:+ start:338 stop:832 length:495 start_codon:yes stop_codon:yes gene_type:complete
MTRNEERSNTTREAASREVEEEYTFEEPDALSIPDSVQAKFDNEEMSLRWIRISVRGEDDITNVGKNQQQGWVFVTPDEVPEMAVTSFVRDEGRYLGAVCRGDLALAKKPTVKVRARQKFYENKANEQMDAVNAQLMKNSDSRMPITNTSKSVTTRGRQPSFQD